MMPWRPSDDYSPEEHNWRDSAEWEERCERTVERLLASLRPEDAEKRLISWENIKKWNLPRRSRPA